ncbi:MULTISPECIES: DoxX family protein [Paracoccus]|uniref:DoxX family protein n=1 Tax=Paracoccus TaxID=265 RepID=UPI0003B4AD12|nr:MULTISPECIES: DoxX family protein [Paracoccus]
MNRYLNIAGRVLIAILFAGGALQKIADPAPVARMIAGIGLPGGLVWTVAAFNALAAVCLVFGPYVRAWALLLAIYCIGTSWFHWQLRVDPWQVSIMVKNWAIAGGLLILASQPKGR